MLCGFVGSLFSYFFGLLGGADRLSLSLACCNTPFYLHLVLLDFVLELEIVGAADPGLHKNWLKDLKVLTDFCSSDMAFHSSPMILEHAGREASKKGK